MNKSFVRAPHTRIEELDFSARTWLCLTNADILTLDELTQVSEMDLMNIGNFNRKSLAEVKETLASLGLSLKDSLKGAYLGGDDDDDTELKSS